MVRAAMEGDRAVATPDEVRNILGNVDDAKMLAIMDLHPTIPDIEEAFAWLSGDLDVFGPSRALKDIPGRIVEILTADEDEESPRTR